MGCILYLHTYSLFAYLVSAHIPSKYGDLGVRVDAQALFARSHAASLAVCAFGCFLAALITMLVPRETTGESLQDCASVDVDRIKREKAAA
jgi:hypothetical protein